MFGIGASSKTPRRPMKYPYTLSAKIAQFPYKFYYKNSWVFRYYIYSLVLSAPFFYWVQTLACSPENTNKWNEIRRREAEEGRAHAR